MARDISATLLRRFGMLPIGRTLLARLGEVDPVYVVGGTLRDLLLGEPPLDLDLVVEADPRPVADRLGEPVRSHDRFGTCTVKLGDVTIDLARARTETYARPGALPSVTPATITDDLRRRDFTVNAIALGLTGARRGRVVQAPNALADVERKTLRVLHDASFLDDPTRLLRLCRYASRLHFGIEDRTADLAAEAVVGGALRSVSGARIGAELRLLAAESDPIGAIQGLQPFGIDEALAPGFGLGHGEDSRLADRALSLLPADGDRGALVLAVALRGVEPCDRASLLTALAFSAERRRVILTTSQGASQIAGALREARTPSEIAQVASGQPLELIALAGALEAEEAARAWLGQLRGIRLEIDGDDLLRAGVAPGPQVGAGLSRALQAHLDGDADDRESQLREALRAARLAQQ